MNNKRSREYDAFGPWIYQIDDINKMPPLFRKYEYLQTCTQMLFKIPRKVERRNICPADHMYDMVVGVLSDGVIILQRKSDDIEEIRVEFERIGVIRNTQNILSGKVELFLNAEIISFEYNTVSQRIIDKFIRLLRAVKNLPVCGTEFKKLDYTEIEIEILYTNLLNEMTKEDAACKIVAYQPEFMPLKKIGMFAVLKRLFRRRLVFCSNVFVSNTRELIIINRSMESKEKGEANYAYSFVYIPLMCINDVEIITEKEQQYLIIKANYYIFKIIINDNNVGIDLLIRTLRKL